MRKFALFFRVFALFFIASCIGTGCKQKGFTDYEWSIEFDSQGGSYVATQYVTTGVRTLRPTDPTRSGYAFDHWYTKDSEGEYGEEFDFNTRITEDYTLYAMWSEAISVAFESQGGSAVTTQAVAKGGTIKEPQKPTMNQYYDFDGWYSDKAYSTEWNFSDNVGNSDITLYAKWRLIDADNTTVVNIYNKEDLILFQSIVNSGRTSVDANIYADIDLNGIEWAPIASGNSNRDYYLGNLNGNGHIISNLTIEDSNLSRVGFFGAIRGSTIKNLTLNSPKIASTSNSSIVAGALSGTILDQPTISNCSVEGGTISIAAGSAGGLIGSISYYANANATTTIIDCYSSATITAAADYFSATANLGGIAGYVGNHTTFERCYNKGAISGDMGSYSYSGGLAGRASSNLTINFEECFNSGKIVASSGLLAYAGGLIGYIEEVTSSAAIKFTRCYNIGSVSSTTTPHTSSAGGLVGRAGDSGSTIVNYVAYCYNAGSVAANKSASTCNVGGLYGYVFNVTAFNSYYAYDEAHTTKVGTAKSDSELKSSYFANYTLDSKYWEYDSDNKNQGYPRLKSISYN